MDEIDNQNIKIVLTGGFSILISNHLEIKHELDETITLYGLKSILSENHE